MTLRMLLAIAATLGATACATVDNAAHAVRGPQLTPVSDPSLLPARGAPVRQPVAIAELEARGPNSLWRAGSRTFFNDQRAARIGDILTVRIEIEDRAQVQNSTTRNRTGEMNAGVTNLFGFESQLNRVLPNAVDPGSLIEAQGGSSSSGTGTVNRQETVELTVAAVITEVLANGNFVIAGSQEVRINSELRELLVSGVIRPQDISSDNTILHSQIAEARISYGGRGDISAVQRPKAGQRVFEAVTPF